MAMRVYLHRQSWNGLWIAIDLETASVVAGPAPREDVEAQCQRNGWRIIEAD